MSLQLTKAYLFWSQKSTHNGYMPLKRVKRRRVVRSESRVAKGATPHRLRRSAPLLALRATSPDTGESVLQGSLS